MNTTDNPNSSDWLLRKVFEILSMWWNNYVKPFDLPSKYQSFSNTDFDEIENTNVPKINEGTGEIK